MHKHKVLAWYLLLFQKHVNQDGIEGLARHKKMRRQCKGEKPFNEMYKLGFFCFISQVGKVFLLVDCKYSVAQMKGRRLEVGNIEGKRQTYYQFYVFVDKDQ